MDFYNELLRDLVSLLGVGCKAILGTSLRRSHYTQAWRDKKSVPSMDVAVTVL
jgi:hypothetical protein